MKFNKVVALFKRVLAKPPVDSRVEKETGNARDLARAIEGEYKVISVV